MSLFCGIASVNIPVSDMRAAERWYSEILGARLSEYRLDRLSPLKFEGLDGPAVTLVCVESSARLKLWSGDDGEYPMGAFAFSVRNAKETYALLKQRGVHVFEPYESEDGEMSFVFEDLDGNYLEITDMN